MPFYSTIDESTPMGQRTLERLLLLRQRLAEEIPQRTLEETLLLATWNLREFGAPSYGDRLDESIFYIAEIIAHFDLVAVQEVRRDLDALKRLMRVLGGYWKYIVTDVTEGRKGNRERMAFLYDSRKVRFGGLAGELVLPPIRVEGQIRPVEQVARTPFIAGFKAGWTKFLLTTVHILYGTSRRNDPNRVREIDQVAQFLRSRTLQRSAWAKDLIVLGDFNIFDPEDVTMTKLLDAGFVVPEELKNLPSNAPQSKYYDQIAFRVRRDRFGTTGRAGVFNFFEVVFKEGDEALYVDAMGDAYRTTSAGEPRKNPSRHYRTWRTYQMSDHLPMWVELKIDYTEEYLKRRVAHA